MKPKLSKVLEAVQKFSLQSYRAMEANRPDLWLEARNQLQASFREIGLEEHIDWLED